MNDAPKMLPLRKSEIIVESDWLTTVEAVLGGIVCSLLLVSEIRHFMWGHFAPPAVVHRDFFHILNDVCRVIACAFAFVLAFEFRRKLLKVGCFLGGLSLAASSLLSFLHMSPRAFHTMAMARSVVWQVVLVILLVVIAQWLKSVARKAPAESPGGES